MKKNTTIRNITVLALSMGAFLLFHNLAAAQTAYASLNFSSGEVVAKGVTSYSLNNCRLEDRYDESHHLYMFSGDTFSFKINFSEAPKKTVLKIKHLSSADASTGKTGKAGKTPISLYVNGEKAKAWSGFSSGYEVGELTISGLKEGENTFELRYSDNGGTSGYWVKYIQVYIY